MKQFILNLSALALLIISGQACTTDTTGLPEDGYVPPSETPADPAPEQPAPPVAQPHCGWRTHNGFIQTGMLVDVQAYPDFRFITDRAVEVEAGQDVEFALEAGSTNGCGDLRIKQLFYTVVDLTEGAHAWMKPLNDARVGSVLYATSGGNTYGSGFAASNMDITPTGNELMYIWNDGDLRGVSGSYGGTIPTQTITASGKSQFRFIWKGSAYAPKGRAITIRLDSIVWEDATTGQYIHSDQLAVRGAEMTVTVK